MITVYSTDTPFNLSIIDSSNQTLLKTALWIDLLNPTPEDFHLIKTMVDLNIPSRTDMKEIEFSSRFYLEQNALFMTAGMISKSQSETPVADAITMVLTDAKFLTIRYVDSQSFALFKTKLTKHQQEQNTAQTLLINFLETTIDRLADILETIGMRLDESSKAIFNPGLDIEKEKLNYKNFLQQIGGLGDLNTNIRESLISYQLTISFFKQHSLTPLTPKVDSQLVTLLKDITSLNDYANFISNKISFLLSATLGFVNIEQNNTIKIFSVAAVIFLPPTLIASMYGMNFHIIPELSWKYGYLYAILLMLFSAFLPYVYFKQKKWL